MTRATPRRRRPSGRGLTVPAWVNLILAFITVLVVAGTVVGAVVLHRNMTATDELTDRLLPASATALQMQGALTNQETGVRGYALSGGDESFLQPYRDGQVSERHSADRIRVLVAARPELIADLDAVQAAAARWRAESAAPLIAAAKATPGYVPPDNYARGKVLFDDLRATFAQQNRHLSATVDAAQTRVDEIRTLRNIILAVLAVALIVTALAFAVLVRIAVTNPLARLSASSRRVADGNFDERVDAGRGPADIRALASDIEEMRHRIVEELAVVKDRQTQLQEQTEQLDAQAVELRRSNADLEQFAYVASHDLQEPLRKVASFCQLLEKRYGDQLDDRGRQYIDFAVDGARRMQTLINDLLTFSRVGRASSGLERVPLAAPLERAMRNLTAVIEETGARVDAPAKLPDVAGDPALLTMLWQNLLGNAVKFAPDDTTPRVTIAIENDPDASMWRVCVQDNGIGVAEEFADKIFVIFQRLHTRESYTGTGIGLALCKKIVEYHGGTIWLDTDYSPGARFCFTLPTVAVLEAEANKEH